jgi:hypothetical protein
MRRGIRSQALRSSGHALPSLACWRDMPADDREDALADAAAADNDDAPLELDWAGKGCCAHSLDGHCY